MKYRHFFLLAAACLALIGVTGCSRSKFPDDGRLKIVTTVGMVTDIVRQVAGETAEVTGLLSPGVDPHLYKASQGDVMRLSKAEIVFYCGLHLEGKMADILEKMSRKKTVIAVAEAIPVAQRRELPGFAGHYDPHVWMDPSLWKWILDPIVTELSRKRPQFAATFRARADSLRAQFDELHLWAGQELATIPKERRVLVTAHDAFGYFGRAYDVEVRGLQGVSTATDFGLADVGRLVDLISSRGIKAVFVESSVPQKPLQAVLEGCRARGHNVRIGGTLYSDALGEPGTPEGTYFGMIRHNVRTIVEALR